MDKKTKNQLFDYVEKCKRKAFETGMGLYTIPDFKLNEYKVRLCKDLDLPLSEPSFREGKWITQFKRVQSGKVVKVFKNVNSNLCSIEIENENGIFVIPHARLENFIIDAVFEKRGEIEKETFASCIKTTAKRFSLDEAVIRKFFLKNNP